MILLNRISDIARDVYRQLGPGHMEAPYQKAMEVGLRLNGLSFEAQKVIEIKYHGFYVGDCNIDLLIEGIAVELKAVAQALGEPERQQLRRYMALLGVTSGLLINFAQAARSKKGALAHEPEIMTVEA